ncbi:MAG: hypothetical protein NTZ34_06470 [Chloroflexi bacterium]|nr:hypothetical protein [Chloroflexota bacterium]
MRAKYIWAFSMSFALVLFSLNACANPVKPAEFNVYKMDVSPTEVAPSENVTATAIIGNSGGVADNYTTILNIDGKERARQIITIEPSENKTISFSVIEPSIGKHIVTIGPVTRSFKTYDLEKYTLKHDTDSYDTNFSNELFSHDYPYTNFDIKARPVVHEIQPPVTVQGEFIVDFISHSENTEPGSHQVKKAVYLDVDSSSDGSKYIGISYSGKNSQSLMNASIQYMPTLAHAAWAIQVEGMGKQTEAVITPQVGTGPSLQGIPVTLRYDNLNTDVNYINQIAVWHSYAKLSLVNMGIAGTQISTPLIILPYKEGSVCLYKDLSGGYKYLSIGTSWYPGVIDEKIELNKGGWGLATTFYPEKTPFSIQNIKIAGVANYTLGTLDDYNNKYIAVRILNRAAEVIWSKYFKWSDFRNLEIGQDRRSKAFWRDVAVDNVVVDDDFTVDVLALGKGYDTSGESYDYYAVAYEKIPNCGTSTTNSFISENGKRSDPCIGLYDQNGNRVCFNLCIRVDGIY